MPESKTKILRLPTVMERTGLSRSSIYAYIKKGDFPAPINISLRNVGWLETEINEFIESRISETRTQN